MRANKLTCVLIGAAALTAGFAGIASASTSTDTSSSGIVTVTHNDGRHRPARPAAAQRLRGRPRHLRRLQPRSAVLPARVDRLTKPADTGRRANAGAAAPAYMGGNGGIDRGQIVTTSSWPAALTVTITQSSDGTAAQVSEVVDRSGDDVAAVTTSISTATGATGMK